MTDRERPVQDAYTTTSRCRSTGEIMYYSRSTIPRPMYKLHFALWTMVRGVDTPVGVFSRHDPVKFAPETFRTQDYTARVHDHHRNPLRPGSYCGHIQKKNATNVKLTVQFLPAGRIRIGMDYGSFCFCRHWPSQSVRAQPKICKKWLQLFTHRPKIEVWVKAPQL